ncbi:MAG: hypothetical protein JWO43_322 [Candidatus Adlerbacteria bacterium]|nr:hypothetical protein [Candidatus Adlerbacteria bacterium]
MAMTSVREKIEQAVAQTLADLGAANVPFAVERPADMLHGDYSTNAALVVAKLLKKNPKDVAQEIADKLTVQGVKTIDIAGPGFINFTLAGNAVKDIVHEAHETSWGSNNARQGQKIMVEYTDPNPFKEFHIGHLMSNAIGESIARLFEAGGADVKRANYQGDVGLHVAKTIWAVKNKKVAGADWGAAYVAGNTAYETDEVAKKEIQEINVKVYDRTDDAINALYDEGRESSLAHFEEIYKKLGTKFDEYFFESQTWKKGLGLVQNNIGQVFEASDGAVIYRGEQDGLHTRVFINAAGLPTYEAKDLGLLALKAEKGEFDVSVTVTASEQTEYFKVVLAAAKHIDEVQAIAERTQHVSHGMMRFADGKMSSRTGNVVTGESLLADLTEAARGREDVAVGAIKYTVLKSASSKDIVFDPEKSLSLDGDSGPYLQYALVRTRSLLRKAAEAQVVDPQPAGAMPVERLIVHFPEVVEYAATELEPHYVTTYLTELASAFNSWYAQERLIVDGAITTRSIAVLKAIENTLAQGLKVLGIPTPEEM